VNKENISAVVKPSFLELLGVNKIIPLTEGGSVIDTFYLSFDIEVFALFMHMYIHIHSVNPTFVHQLVNMKHVRRCTLHNAS
jgi:hypothetical protein